MSCSGRRYTELKPPYDFIFPSTCNSAETLRLLQLISPTTSNSVLGLVVPMPTFSFTTEKTLIGSIGSIGSIGGISKIYALPLLVPLSSSSFKYAPIIAEFPLIATLYPNRSPSVASVAVNFCVSF